LDEGDPSLRTQAMPAIASLAIKALDVLVVTVLFTILT
jgi:hypothetical protein